MDAETIAAIKARATQIAADAPPFTTEQAHLLFSLFTRATTRDVGQE